MVSFRFQQCLVPLTMLVVEGSSETWLFRDLFSHVFRVPNFGNTSAMRVIFFFNFLKFNLDFKIAEKNSENVFCFSDNSIWIGCLELSLLRRKHLSSAVNVLTNSLMPLHITKKVFSNSLAFTVINKYGKGGVVDVSTVFGPNYHLACRRVLGSFLDIYLTTFFGCCTFTNTSAMRVLIFFENVQKLI